MRFLAISEIITIVKIHPGCAIAFNVTDYNSIILLYRNVELWLYVKIVPKVKITQCDAGEGDRDTGGRHEDNQRGEKHKCREKPRPDRKETKPRNGSQKKIVKKPSERCQKRA